MVRSQKKTFLCVSSLFIYSLEVCLKVFKMKYSYVLTFSTVSTVYPYNIYIYSSLLLYDILVMSSLTFDSNLCVVLYLGVALEHDGKDGEGSDHQMPLARGLVLR